jgi:hypothetical protein
MIKHFLFRVLWCRTLTRRILEEGYCIVGGTGEHCIFLHIGEQIRTVKGALTKNIRSARSRDKTLTLVKGSTRSDPSIKAKKDKP